MVFVSGAGTVGANFVIFSSGQRMKDWVQATLGATFEAHPETMVIANTTYLLIARTFFLRVNVYLSTTG